MTVLSARSRRSRPASLTVPPERLPGAGEDLWVFGYGSLMWRPGFPFEERHVARLPGYHRRLCVYSHFHRGTAEDPGLVMGLDRGGSCKGLAYRVSPHHAADTIAYLREREQVTTVYLERILPVRLAGGQARLALTYVADRSHAQYAGALEHETLLRFVTQGRGVSGANPDYVHATHRQLLQLGVNDAALSWLVRHLPVSPAD